MKSKPTMHFSNMIEMLQGDHIVGIRYIKSLNLGCNEMKYAVAGAACYYARMLRNDSARRDEFYKEALQVKWVRLHRSKLLLHVVMYLEDAPKKGNKYKLASARRVALQGVCDDSDIPDEDIADYIKQHHGFKGLIQPDDEVPFDEEEIDKETRQTPGPLAGRPGRSGSIFSKEDVELCVLGRLKPEDRAEVLQAFRDGKSVKAKLVPGETMEKHELYKGGRSIHRGHHRRVLGGGQLIFD